MIMHILFKGIQSCFVDLNRSTWPIPTELSVEASQHQLIDPGNLKDCFRLYFKTDDIFSILYFRSAPVSRQYAGGVYRSRPSSGRYPTRPVYRPPVAPIGGAQAASMGGLSAALGAIGGTLGCLLCLSAIAALGLFSCVVALTAYASKLICCQFGQ